MSSKRSSSFSRSSSIIECNEDLLLEILIFLPPKALIRFKAVTKRWRSLISSLFFCRRHTLHHRREAQQPSFILAEGDMTEFLLLNTINRRLSPFPVFDEFSYVKVLQSCNGLLLLRCRNTFNGRDHYFVANPTTAQQRSLSPLPGDSFSGLYLIFDPSLSPHYKVVCFGTERSTRFHIYDSDTQQWKLGGTTNRFLSFRHGTYFNGGICFLRFRPSSSYRFVADGNVISNLPDLPRQHGSEERHKNYTMESNGVLLYLTLSWKEQSNQLRIHVSEMKNSEEGWRKKFSVETRRWFEKSRFESIGECVGLLGMIIGESEGDSSLLLRLKKNNIAIYKFGDGVFDTVDEYQEFQKKEFQMYNQWWDLKCAHHFIPSLAPV